MKRPPDIEVHVCILEESEDAARWIILLVPAGNLWRSFWNCRCLKREFPSEFSARMYAWNRRIRRWAPGARLALVSA